MIRRNMPFRFDTDSDTGGICSSAFNAIVDGRGNHPFLLRPAGKDYLWGGQRLNDDYSKGIDLDPLAETWECSTHPDGPSTVASGTYKGLELRRVLEIRPDFLGTHPKGLVEEGLPVLIKFIDAMKNLSVQVHPSDEHAREHENGQLGKSEMWYVIDAEKGAKLVYGLRVSDGCDEGTD